MKAIAIISIVFVLGGISCRTADATDVRILSAQSAAPSTADKIAAIDVRILNPTDQIVYIELPNPGSERIVFVTRGDWVSRFGNAVGTKVQTDASIQVVAGVRQSYVLKLEPGGSGVLTIDLRDHFSQIDFNNPSVKISLKLVAIMRDVANVESSEGQKEAEIAWSGEVVFEGTPKGVTILF